MRGLLLALCLLAVAAPARAGSEAGPADPLPIEAAAAFSKQIERHLAASGARAALVFRTGRAREDLPDGVRYTHGALWIYQEFELADGTRARGYATWNLFHHAETRTRSYIARQFPLDFVRGAHLAEVGVIVPSPEMQRRLVELVASGGFGALHQPDYSLVSNPHDARYQNCNEFLLDLVAAAAWQTSDRARIKANLAAWFEPAVLRVSPLERLLGPMADERLRTADQAGATRTTTFAALAAFIQTHALAAWIGELQFAPEA